MATGTKTEDIIFLGSGVSRAEGAPVQAELFKQIYRTWSGTYF